MSSQLKGTLLIITGTVYGALLAYYLNIYLLNK